MNDLWLEFSTIALVHLLAVASPGPDFAVVLKVALTQPRRVALYTSIGIGMGILIHVVYSLLGINILFKTLPWLYQTLLWCCAAYLFYIGFKAIQVKAPEQKTQLVSCNETKRPTVADSTNTLNTSTQAKVSNTGSATMSAFAGFKLGFITNGLNPKASLFFLSLFTVVIAPDTPIPIKAAYGLYLAFATGVWFCTLSIILSHSRIQSTIEDYAHWIDRIMGGILIFLALSLVVNY